MAEKKVQEALWLLEEAGHLDILKDGVGGPSRPPRRASGGVAAAVMASLRDSDGRQAVRRRGGGRSRSRAGGAVAKGRWRALQIQKAGPLVSPQTRGPEVRARGTPPGRTAVSGPGIVCSRGLGARAASVARSRAPGPGLANRENGSCGMWPRVGGFAPH
ncbi:hypothetical protein NDU88_001816 [Pleurodeles waltl]|uniref:Uncharacterized protein n=1 Tax=Pleurodeles waltl TaxID=8319 RepID=A0AAV7M0D6_PLEWA|nr:hypothetical protein NDU88_001816 [Pleurodeles waltl]